MVYVTFSSPILHGGLEPLSYGYNKLLALASQGGSAMEWGLQLRPLRSWNRLFPQHLRIMTLPSRLGTAPVLYHMRSHPCQHHPHYSRWPVDIVDPMQVNQDFMPRSYKIFALPFNPQLNTSPCLLGILRNQLCI